MRAVGSTFSRCHPAVPALWFALVLAFTVTTFHPLLLGTALGCCWLWWGRLGGRPHPGRLLTLALVAALLNPLFSHGGVTVLSYFPNGNPLTLESVLYGLGAGLMLLSALACLGCMSRVMTADRWMCLLGKGAPTLALLLSMTLGAVPRLRARWVQVGQAQRQVGRLGRRRIERARLALRRLGVVLSWSLEGAMVRADSMEARGYGLPGRVSYTTYRLTAQDRGLLAFLACAGGYLLVMAAAGALSWRYYPSLRWSGASLWLLSALADWLCLCGLPLYLEWKEEGEWNSSGWKT